MFSFTNMGTVWERGGLSWKTVAPYHISSCGSPQLTVIISYIAIHLSLTLCISSVLLAARCELMFYLNDMQVCSVICEET